MERRRKRRRRETVVLPLVILAAVIAVLQRMTRKKMRMTGTASDSRYSLLDYLTHSPPTHTHTHTHTHPHTPPHTHTHTHTPHSQAVTGTKYPQLIGTFVVTIFS